GLHLGQNFRRVLIVHVALQQLQDVEPVVVIADEVREQHVQPVVNRDKFVPVLGAAAQLGFVLGKTRAREIVLLNRVENVFVRETGAVERDAHAGRKNRVDETSGVADQ